MCLGTPSTGVPEGHVIVKLSFQGRVEGHNTDDLVIDFQSPSGDPGTLRMQLKRTLSPTASNSAFKEAVGLAWLDFKAPVFRRGRDVLLIVFQPPSAKAMEAAMEVTRLAVASTTGEVWRDKVEAEKFSNEKSRTAMAAIATATRDYNGGADAPIGELHQFATHLRFVVHDLDSDTTAEAVMQQQLLALIVTSDLAGVYWAKLVAICAELNGVGGDVDLDSLERHLGAELAVALRAFRALRSQGTSIINFAQADRVDDQNAALDSSAQPQKSLIQQPATAAFSDSAPSSRPGSLNKLVSRQLDSIGALHKQLRYREAAEQLEVLGQDQHDFDDYQRALWHLLRGVCRWHWHGDLPGAAQDFLKAADLTDDEAKFAAARIRGHLLNEDVTSALASGEAATRRFPAASEVWAAHANARVVSGARLSENEIPVEHQKLAIAWQILAGSQERIGDFAAAFAFALRSVEQVDASFFNRETLLRYALLGATQSKLAAGYAMLTLEQTHRLRIAIDVFSDRQSTLWTALQAPKALAAVIVNLGVAYLLVGEPQAALDVIAEAFARGLPLDGLEVRIELDASRDLKRQEAALERLEGQLGTMPDDALVAFGQAAVDVRDETRLMAAVAQANQRKDGPDGSRLVRTFRFLRWEYLLRAGRSDQVRKEVVSEGVDATSSSIADLVYAVRAHSNEEGNREYAEQLLDRVVELLKTSASDLEIYLGAQVLHQHRRFRDAADAYYKILPGSASSELHVDLMSCLLRSGHRAKAKMLLESLAPGWEASERMRHLAIDLAQLSRDWVAIDRLSKIQLEAAPRLCRSWLLRIGAVHRTTGGVAGVIKDIPLDLEGSLQEIAQLATIELRDGQEEKGLLRLYQMRRRSLSETEAAALHLKSVLLIGKTLEALDNEPVTAAPGTCVEVTGEDGTSRYWTIDPDILKDLPATDEFVRSTTHNAKRLLGTRVGDEIVIEGKFGESRKIRVTRILSAHRRLIDLSNFAIQTTLTPTDQLVSMQMRTAPDGNLELDAIREQLERRVAFTSETLALYKQHPSPLGIIGKRLGVDVVDLVRGWGHEGPKLEVASDWNGSVLEAQQLLSGEARWVIDLTTLTELAMLGQLDLLRHLPSALVTSATRDTIEAKLEQAVVYRKSGTMFTHEGKLGFHENTEEEWSRDREFLRTISDVVKSFCEVVPAYGPVEVEENLHGVRKVLSEEEYSSLLLCLQIDANLLSLDGRFRQVCALFGVKGAWPQAFLLHMQPAGHLSQADYSLAVLKMLMSRRTFVALSARDLLRMLDEGDEFVQFVLQRLQEYLSDGGADFHSTARVIFEFLFRTFRRGRCEFGAALELLAHFAEALMRHPHVPGCWSGACVILAWFSFGAGADREKQMVVETVLHAAEKAKQPFEPRKVELVVEPGLPFPTLVYAGQRIADPEAKESMPADTLRTNAPELLLGEPTAETPREKGTPGI